MMRRFITAPLSILFVIILGLLAQAQQRPYRGTYQSVRQTILRLETRANLFRNSIEAWSQSDTAANVTSENVNATDEDVNLMGRDFADSAHSLRNRFTARQSTSSDVQQVLSHAARIDDFVRRNSVDAGSMNYWSSIRVDLNQLAYAYNLTWPQSTQYNPPSGNQPYNPPSGNQPYYPLSGNQYGLQRLSGTYRVDRSRSEDARTAINRARSGSRSTIPTIDTSGCLAYARTCRSPKLPTPITPMRNGLVISVFGTRWTKHRSSRWRSVHRCVTPGARSRHSHTRSDRGSR